ncbi:MAG: O-antigen ligase family protein [Flavisolibacter sp.]
MNTLRVHRILVFFLSLLLLGLTGWAAYAQEPLWGWIPFGGLLALWLLQHPRDLLYLLLFSIPWSVEWSVGPSLSTDLPDEPLMLLTAYACILLLIRKKNGGEKKLHPLYFLLLLQFAWAFLTVLSSTHILVSTKYLLAKGWYLLAFAGMPFLVLRGEREIKRAASVLCVSMLLFVCLALIRHQSYHWSFEKVNEALRPFFKNHVNYSALLVPMVPLILAFIGREKKRWAKNLLVLVLLLTLAALYLSYARGAWLALVTGGIGYKLLQQKKLVTGFVVFLLLAIAAVFWLKDQDRYLAYAPDYRSTIFHTNFEEHLVATYHMKDLSTAERYYRWIAGVRMIKDGWITGFGPETFYENYKGYTIPAFKTWVSSNPEHSTVHNYFLLLLVEQGAVGCLLFVLLLGFAFSYAQRIYHRAPEGFWKTVSGTVAVILVMLATVNFLSDLIETDKVGGLFYLCIAVLVIADKNTRVGKGREVASENTGLLPSSDFPPDIQGIP